MPRSGPFPTEGAFRRLRPDGALVTQLRGPVEAEAAFALPWRVVLLGETKGWLVEHGQLVQSLNPPYAMADTSWTWCHASLLPRPPVDTVTATAAAPRPA